MAKVSEEGINIGSLVNGIRTKVNDTNPDDREKYVRAMGQYLGVQGNDINAIAPQIAPALKRAKSKQLIDIATTIGVKPSKHMSFPEQKGRINITNSYDSNDIISANRRPLDQSITPQEERRQAVNKAAATWNTDLVKAGAESVLNSAGEIHPDKAQRFIETGSTKTDGWGTQFLNAIFKKPDPSPTQVRSSQIKAEAEIALEKGLNPEFVSDFVESDLRQQAIDILRENDQLDSEANIEYVMSQLKEDSK